MPNWIEGTLKVRGTLENVKRFLLEGLNDYNCSSAYYVDPVPTPKENWLMINDNKEWGYYEIDFDNAPYVEGTSGAFVFTDGNHALYYEKEWNEPAIAIMKVRQAWTFLKEEWVEISKKYDVDLRLYGLEQGMEFGYEIEIIKGEVTLNEKLEYGNWKWECPFPYLGG